MGSQDGAVWPEVEHMPEVILNDTKQQPCEMWPPL